MVGDAASGRPTCRRSAERGAASKAGESDQIVAYARRQRGLTARAAVFRGGLSSVTCEKSGSWAASERLAFCHPNRGNSRRQARFSTSCDIAQFRSSLYFDALVPFDFTPLTAKISI
jgi:hypothetical protein